MSLKPIGLFYGTSTCYTEMAAERIGDLLGGDLVDIHNIANTPVELMEQYDHLLLGIPTWDYGELQEDWDAIWEQLDELNLHGKPVALFGLGDQVGYPQWFQDALGYLAHKVKSLGAQLCGEWPNQGYQFEASKGLTEDGSHFLGLALDEDTQFEQSETRIAIWCQQLRRQWQL